jgi:hypothetical protein
LCLRVGSWISTKSFKKQWETNWKRRTYLLIK